MQKKMTTFRESGKLVTYLIKHTVINKILFLDKVEQSKCLNLCYLVIMKYLSRITYNTTGKI